MKRIYNRIRCSISFGLIIIAEFRDAFNIILKRLANSRRNLSIYITVVKKIVILKPPTM